MVLKSIQKFWDLDFLSDKKIKSKECEVNIVFNKQTSVRELTLVWGWRRGGI